MVGKRFGIIFLSGQEVLYLLCNQLKHIEMNKHLIIGQVRTFLSTVGIEEGPDYLISLQGPTVIPTMAGSEKLTESISDEVKKLGALIL
jgi:hypothetical protein